MKKLLLTVAIMATTLGAMAQTPIGTTTANTVVQGKDVTITSQYKTIITGGAAGAAGTHVEIGGASRNTVITGSSTSINTSNTTINTAGGTFKAIGTTINLQGGNTNITGHNTKVSTTYTSLNSAQTFINGEKTEFRQGVGSSKTLTTISQTGISTAGSVTGAQLFTGGMNIGNEIINLKNDVNSKASASSVTNLTNRVTGTESNINNLYSVKADKVQVTADIATAKAQAIATSNAYTNTEVNRLDGRINTTNAAVSTLDTKVNTQVTRLDGRIDALDLKVDATNITVENNRVEAAKATAQVQSNLDATNATVQANKVEAKNYTDSKVGALENKMTSEFKRVDTKIETEVNRLDSKIDRNDAEIRRDLRTETDRLTRADAQLFAEMSGLGATMMAMGSMQSSAVYSPTKKGNVSFGSGVYRDSFAYAASVSYYVNPNTRISSTVAGGTKTKVGGGLGVSFGF